MQILARVFNHAAETRAWSWLKFNFTFDACYTLFSLSSMLIHHASTRNRNTCVLDTWFGIGLEGLDLEWNCLLATT